MIRRSEIKLRFRSFRYFLAGDEFPAVVRHHRRTQTLPRLQLPLHSPAHLLRSSAFHPMQQGEFRSPLHHRHHSSAMPASCYSVRLPVPEPTLLIHHRRPLRCIHPVNCHPSSRPPLHATVVLPASMPQMTIQLPSLPAVPPDVSIYGCRAYTPVPSYFRRPAVCSGLNR